MPPILITSKEESCLFFLFFFCFCFFNGTSCATVSCIRSLNMRRHGEAAGLCIWTPVQRLGPGICISSNDSWRSLFNTLFILWVIFRTSIRYQPLLHFALEDHKTSTDWKGQVGSGQVGGGGTSQWRTAFVFPVKWRSRLYAVYLHHCYILWY